MQIDPACFAATHLDLLYVRDDRGRLLRSRDPDVASPLVHLVRSSTGNCWSVAARLDDGLATKLERALADVPPLLDPLKPGDMREFDTVRSLVAAPASTSSEDSGPVYAFRAHVAHLEPGVEELADPAAAQTVPELTWIRRASREALPICIVRNETGDIVSVCHSARSTATAAEGGVETAAAYRGQGLAARVVQGWADVVLAGGRTPVYSTSWRNHASRAVAAKLGLLAVAEDWRIG